MNPENEGLKDVTWEIEQKIMSFTMSLSKYMMAIQMNGYIAQIQQ